MKKNEENLGYCSKFKITVDMSIGMCCAMLCYAVLHGKQSKKENAVKWKCQTMYNNNTIWIYVYMLGLLKWNVVRNARANKKKRNRIKLMVFNLWQTISHLFLLHIQIHRFADFRLNEVFSLFFYFIFPSLGSISGRM